MRFLHTTIVAPTSSRSRCAPSIAFTFPITLPRFKSRRPSQLCGRGRPPGPPLPPNGPSHRSFRLNPSQPPSHLGVFALVSRSSSRRTSNRDPPPRRLRISHLLLALNVLVFLAQGATGGRLLLAGAKVNASIAAGELHRIITPMFLHASISHLLINCFSLYSTGPAVESWFGRARFTSLYVFAGVTGNLLSFLCTPTPSVGASGAIFGLVGATAVLLMRHRKILGARSRRGLNSLAYIVLVNFGMGMSPGSRVDNFGHLGGLLGGIIFAWLFGPRLVVGRDGKLVDVPMATMLVKGARDGSLWKRMGRIGNKRKSNRKLGM